MYAKNHHLTSYDTVPLGLVFLKLVIHARAATLVTDTATRVGIIIRQL